MSTESRPSSTPLIAAVATTTVAVGVTVATLVGWLRPPTAPAPERPVAVTTSLAEPPAVPAAPVAEQPATPVADELTAPAIEPRIARHHHEEEDEDDDD